MSDDVLKSLGFYQNHDSYGHEAWTHLDTEGKFYYQILTPLEVRRILVGIGIHKARKAMGDFLDRDLELDF